MTIKTALTIGILSATVMAACAPTPREAAGVGAGTDGGAAEGGSGGRNAGGSGGARIDGGTGPSSGGTDGGDGSVGATDAPGDGAAGGAAGGMAGMNAGGMAGMNAGGMAGMNVGGMAGTPATDVCRHADENQNLDIACPAGSVIKEITFASYGTVSGACPTLAAGACNSTMSAAVVAQKCLGKNQCTVFAGNGEFGGDPCPMVRKKLGVIAKCGM